VRRSPKKSRNASPRNRLPEYQNIESGAPDAAGRKRHAANLEQGLPGPGLNSSVGARVSLSSAFLHSLTFAELHSSFELRFQCFGIQADDFLGKRCAIFSGFFSLAVLNSSLLK
jgi:hypothetical protein